MIRWDIQWHNGKTRTYKDSMVKIRHVHSVHSLVDWAQVQVELTPTGSQTSYGLCSGFEDGIWQSFFSPAACERSLFKTALIFTRRVRGFRSSIYCLAGLPASPIVWTAYQEIAHQFTHRWSMGIHWKNQPPERSSDLESQKAGGHGGLLSWKLSAKQAGGKRQRRRTPLRDWGRIDVRINSLHISYEGRVYVLTRQALRPEMHSMPALPGRRFQSKHLDELGRTWHA